MPDTLQTALAACESLLEQERLHGPNDALIAQKEAATAALSEALAQAPSLDGPGGEALVQRLQSVLAANRFSLKWSGLKVTLAQLGQPKPAAPATARPRIDLVH